MAEEEKDSGKASIVLPNMVGEFHGFNTDRWADTARAVVAYNALDSIEKYALAIDHFENSLINMIDRDAELYGEQCYEKKKEAFLKELSNKYTAQQRIKEIADYKLRELTRLVNKFRTKHKIYIIDPILAREEMLKRQRENYKLEVVEDGNNQGRV